MRLAQAGMEIDFGGIGKEYAADRAATILQERGIAHGLVQPWRRRARVGRPADGTPWHIGIRHPREPSAAVDRVGRLTDGAVATSGDYERYFEHRRAALLPHPRRAHGPAGRRLAVDFGRGAAVRRRRQRRDVGMLLGADAPAWLDAQGVEWLGVDA